MYNPSKEFTFADYGNLPTIAVGDLVILIETEDLMTGEKYYNIDYDNVLGKRTSAEHDYTYHGRLRTVDDTAAVRVKGLHKVLAISDVKNMYSANTHRNITVSADLTEDWE